MTIYEICAQTDQGRVRKNNEDAVAFDAQTGLCLLADGMGGYNAGEIASGMAVTLIKLELGSWLLEAGSRVSARELRRIMETCVGNVNQSIFSAACSNSDYEGMGTTLVVGVFLDSRLVLGHIGDSRCYRLRGHTFQQITKDHSLLQEQIDAGLMTPEEALTAPNKNLITRALGVDNSVLIEINEHRVELGDVYLMCSDGLSDMVPDAAIAAILDAPDALPEKALNLVAAANEGGGRDNISVLLVHAIEDASKRGLLSRILGK
ncbi:MAG: protein phosphatase domain protein [Polaromonas sp.]|jgi:serine/threonine protein phosphatase PrpC|nr:protein phosphatase domain protein [Polaromonas sp.]